MRILVTGGAGFLGTHLVRRLRGDGHTVLAPSSAECDLRRSGSLDLLPAGAFDQVYHLAAWTQAGDFCLRHPGEQWIVNQQMNTNVLEWWRRSASEAKLIAIGTSCSYDPALPLVEENYLEGTPIDSLYTYAHTKRMLLIGLQALQRQFGLRYLYAVPSTLYGPGYHTDGRQMHFIFDLIRKILRGRETGEPVVLWGDGHQRREVVFVDDFVEALVALARSHQNDVVNIGAGEDHSIREFAAMICEQVGFDAHAVQYDERRYVGARAKCLDVRKLRLLMASWKQLPLADGLSRTIQWFDAHQVTLKGTV